MGRPHGRADVDARMRAKERAEARAEVRRRRAEAPWFEWVVEEFARYLYALGILGLFVFVPLQMADSWLPAGRPPLVEPSVVTGIALAFFAATGLLAFLGYRHVWGESGPVARAIERRRARAGERAVRLQGPRLVDLARVGERPDDLPVRAVPGTKPFSPPPHRPAGATVDIREVEIENPDHVNVIVGQTHFIKTAEDLHEALVNSVPGIEFGLAFCEASGPCLVRAEGTDPKLKELAARNALAIGASHAFVVLVRNAYPINLLHAIRDVPEVVSVFAATANALTVLVAETPRGRGIVGVVDGEKAKGVESEADVRERRALVRRFGYKL